jgi:phosphoribosylglycinamide formyltransferase 1
VSPEWSSVSSELRFAILASGRGSNAVALMDAFARGFIPARLALVLTNVEGAPVLDKAAARGLPVASVPHAGLPRAEHERRVLATLKDARIDHVLLAGYMRLLSADFLRAFGGRILNIHPALLPDFPGLHAAERQWEAGRKVAGATVHFVDEGVDTGPVVLQGSLEVRGDEGAAGLADRILHEVEHIIYPRAVRLFCDRLRRGEP